MLSHEKHVWMSYGDHDSPEGIQELPIMFPISRSAEKGSPLITQIHNSEADGRDSDCETSLRCIRVVMESGAR